MDNKCEPSEPTQQCLDLTKPSKLAQQCSDCSKRLQVRPLEHFGDLDDHTDILASIRDIDSMDLEDVGQEEIHELGILHDVLDDMYKLVGKLDVAKIYIELQLALSRCAARVAEALGDHEGWCHEVVGWLKVGIDRGHTGSNYGTMILSYENDPEERLIFMAPQICSGRQPPSKTRPEVIRDLIHECCAAGYYDENGITMLKFHFDLLDVRNRPRIADERFQEVLGSLESQQEHVLQLSLFLSIAAITTQLDNGISATRTIAFVTQCIKTITSRGDPGEGFMYETSVPYAYITIMWMIWLAKEAKGDERYSTLISDMKPIWPDMAQLLNATTLIEKGIFEVTRLEALLLDTSWAPSSFDLAARNVFLAPNTVMRRSGKSTLGSWQSQVSPLQWLGRMVASQAWNDLVFDDSTKRFGIKEWGSIVVVADVY